MVAIACRFSPSCNLVQSPNHQRLSFSFSPPSLLSCLFQPFLFIVSLVHRNAQLQPPEDKRVEQLALKASSAWEQQKRGGEKKERNLSFTVESKTCTWQERLNGEFDRNCLPLKEMIHIIPLWLYQIISVKAIYLLYSFFITRGTKMVWEWQKKRQQNKMWRRKE